MEGDLRLGVTHLKNKAYIGRESGAGGFGPDRVDVTEDFKRCVVFFCSESKVFEVDGIKFKATCERIN